VEPTEHKLPVAIIMQEEDKRYLIAVLIDSDYAMFLFAFIFVKVAYSCPAAFPSAFADV
jgi:hypothetical protein